MPENAKAIVTNTTPLIALTAATGNLDSKDTVSNDRIRVKN